jgi:hypothetical protein
MPQRCYQANHDPCNGAGGLCPDVIPTRSKFAQFADESV